MKNYKKTLKLVDQIQKIRSKNNINWMNILRLAFKTHQKVQQKLWLKFIKRIIGYQN